MSILVTGGCGYIGSHIVRSLKGEGEETVIVDDLSYGDEKRAKGSKFYKMDICSSGAKEGLQRIMEECGVKAVIHCAARKQVGESVEKPIFYYRQNVGGFLNVIEAMKDAGVKNMIFSSSAAVYGEPPVDVVPEFGVEMVPINPYGQTKLFGEWMGNAVSEAFKINFCALRYFNVAGCAGPDLADPSALNLIPIVFQRLSEFKAPVIFGDDYPTPDGTCVRDYIHVEDLARAHVSALCYLESEGEKKYSAFNVGTGRGTSVREIIEAIKGITGIKFEEKVEGRRPGDPPMLIGNAELIGRVMGWRSEKSLQDIISSAWQAWQEGPKRIDVGAWKERP
ncbi:MAG: UDP-glucose 4-epimerase GalE [Aeriscardovia sp.]|nr:UDP-glucose 4-epimerase GalE [Aeriscardovia sp.]